MRNEVSENYYQKKTSSFVNGGLGFPQSKPPNDKFHVNMNPSNIWVRILYVLIYPKVHISPYNYSSPKLIMVLVWVKIKNYVWNKVNYGTFGHS